MRKKIEYLVETAVRKALERKGKHLPELLNQLLEKEVTKEPAQGDDVDDNRD